MPQANSHTTWALASQGGYRWQFVNCGRRCTTRGAESIQRQAEVRLDSPHHQYRNRRRNNGGVWHAPKRLVHIQTVRRCSSTQLQSVRPGTRCHGPAHIPDGWPAPWLRGVWLWRIPPTVATHDSQCNAASVVVVGGVDTAVSVVPLKGNRKCAAAALLNVRSLPVHFRGLLTAGDGGRARRRHKATQMRVRER